MSARQLAPAFLCAAVLGSALPVCTARAQDKPEPKSQDKPQEKPKEDGPETAFAKQMVQVLKDELDLSSDQAEKASVIVKEGMKEALKRMLSRMGDEAPNQEQMRKDQGEIREMIMGRLREILDEGQKREFEVLVKEFDQRIGKWERGRNQPGGDALVWFEGEMPSRERLLLKAENVLLLSEDEKKVVLPRVDEVLAARAKVRELRRDQRKDLQKAVNGGADRDEVKERLHALRDRLDEQRTRLSKAEETLRELLTIDQEARLVAIGILD